MTMPNVRRLVVALAGLAIVVLGIAITRGSVTYVTTHGSSMEPGFHQGDLAVLRTSQRYQPGDVVAYRSDDLDTVVMHRIVERDGDRYVFQGDNNSWLDSERPSRDQLLGKLWLRVPEGGRALAWVTSRWPLLAAGAALTAFIGTAAPRRRRRRTGRTMPIPSERSAANTHRRAQASRTAGVAAVSLLAVSAVLGVVAFTRSTHGPTMTDIAYAQRGAFAYSATAARGAAYPDGTVTTGDPVFRQLISSIEVDFAYEIDADAAASLDGEIDLRARISDSNGWQRTIALTPTVTVDGVTGEANGTLDLDRVQSAIDDFAETTGVRSGAHSIELVADVAVTGRLADQLLSETFSAALPFQLDPLQLRPTWEGAGDGDAAALRPSSTGVVSVPDRAANRLTLLGTSVEIELARSIAGATSAGAAIALVTAIACRVRRRDEPARIASRYGDRIVEVTPGDHHDRSVVDVATMGELARLATHHDSLILHERDRDENRYLFHHDRTVYRYTAPSSPALATSTRQAGAHLPVDQSKAATTTPPGDETTGDPEMLYSVRIGEDFRRPEPGAHLLQFRES